MGFRNLQEKLEKHSVSKIVHTFHCSNDLKSFSRSLEQFFLTVGQNNFGNKITYVSLNDWFLEWHSMLNKRDDDTEENTSLYLYLRKCQFFFQRNILQHSW